MVSEKTGTSRYKALISEILVAGILLAVIFPPAKQMVTIYRRGFTSAITIVGRSMSPTFHNGQVVLTEKRPVQRGDVITAQIPPEEAAKYPQYDGAIIIKRVIGIPGDTVRIGQDQSVSVNGEVLTEDYLSEEARGASFLTGSGRFLELTLKPGEYFIMGDNRGNSYDSRFFGPLSASLIRGVVTERNDDSLFLKSWVQILLTLFLLPKPLEWIAGFLVSRLP